MYLDIYFSCVAKKGAVIVDFYELVREINSSRLDHHWDDLPYSFNQLNRAKLENAFDLEVFDLVMKAYGITIIYRSDRRDSDTKNNEFFYRYHTFIKSS